MKYLDMIVKGTFGLWGVETLDGEGIDNVFTLGYKAIPKILDIEETDYLDDLFYDYTTGEISKAKYFKELEEYLKEEK